MRKILIIVCFSLGLSALHAQSVELISWNLYNRNIKGCFALRNDSDSALIIQQITSGDGNKLELEITSGTILNSGQLVLIDFTSNLPERIPTINIKLCSGNSDDQRNLRIPIVLTLANNRSLPTKYLNLTMEELFTWSSGQVPCLTDSIIQQKKVIDQPISYSPKYSNLLFHKLNDQQQIVTSRILLSGLKGKKILLKELKETTYNGFVKPVNVLYNKEYIANSDFLEIYFRIENASLETIMSDKYQLNMVLTILVDGFEQEINVPISYSAKNCVQLKY